MRKIILNIIILSFYAIGIIQAMYNLHFVVSIVVGVCAAALSIYIDDKIKNNK